MIKKIAISFCFVLLIITSCSCTKPSDDDYVNLSNKYNELLDLVYYHKLVSSDVSFELFDKNSLKNSKYSEIYERYSHLDYKNIIIMLADEPIPLILEFGSTQKANEAYINFGSLYFQYKNCIAFDTNISYCFMQKNEGNEEFDDCCLIITAATPKTTRFNDLIKIGGLCWGNGTRVKTLYIQDVNEVAPLAFYSYKKLTDVYILDTYRIGSYAFYNSSVETIYIGPETEYIDEYAFNSGNIFINFASKPEHWPDNFACENAKVYWSNNFYIDSEGNIIPY